MIWKPVPTTNGPGANHVLGQASLYEHIPGTGAGDHDTPGGVWTDGTRVVVADTGNSRVLIWTSFPRTHTEPADIVLGQQGFGTSGFPTTPTGATMRSPTFVHSDGVRLFVSDRMNNRVLVWRSFPTTSGQPADFAIGQPDLTSDGGGGGASQLAFPMGVAVAGDNLFVADSANKRVLVFSPIPTASGSPASFILGQPDFETTSPEAATPQALAFPWGLTVDGNKLYVADFSYNRVLRFHLRL
jgi:DNA-binding beta-propeller fold protein YncE